MEQTIINLLKEGYELSLKTEDKGRAIHITLISPKYRTHATGIISSNPTDSLSTAFADMIGNLKHQISLAEAKLKNHGK